MLKLFGSANNDDGYAIITAMLILIILSLIGISATNNAGMESQIATNAQVQKMAFYAADSGWQVAADFLDDQFPMATVDVGTDISSGSDVILMTVNRYSTPDKYSLSSSKNYSATARFDGAEIAPLWDVELFRSFTYTIISNGDYLSSGSGPPRNADSEITVSAGKIAQTGG
jgi:hypothetical protein